MSEVVGKRVKLKKQGREWRGLSPFNAEKTPSFYVNDQKARFSGVIIDFAGTSVVPLDSPAFACGQGAPARTHAMRSSISSGLSFAAFFGMAGTLGTRWTA